MPVAEFAVQYRQPWRTLSRPALAAWLVFYALFLIYAWSGRGGFLMIDNVNLIVHEAGHLLFSYLGYTLMIWGGTILQLFVPLAWAAYFAYLRQPAATAFCSSTSLNASNLLICLKAGPRTRQSSVKISPCDWRSTVMVNASRR